MGIVTSDGTYVTRAEWDTHNNNAPSNITADHTNISLINNNNAAVGTPIYVPTINGQSIITNSGAGYETGDIQVTCYMDMTNYAVADINNDYNAVADNIKIQTDKWLQTEILNNTTITPSKPKPCILAFRDYQLTLFNYDNSTDGTTSFYFYSFRTPVLSDNQTVKEVIISLATTLNSEQIAFDSYNINGVTLNDTVISGGGSTNAIENITVGGNSVVKDDKTVNFNSKYFDITSLKSVTLIPDAIIANATDVAMQSNLPKISSATAQPAGDQEAGIYIRVYNNITSANITYYNLVNNTYNTEVPGFSGTYWVKYAVKWLADTSEFEIQQIPGKAEDFNGTGIKMIDFLSDYVYGKENMYAIISQKDRLEFGINDYTKNYFKAGVKLKWEQVSGLAPNQLATDMVYDEGINKVIVRVPQPANFTYAKVIGSYGESPTGIPVEPLYRIYPEFPTDNGDYILKLNHSIATVGGGEKLTWETYSPGSGSAVASAATVNGQPIISNTEGETGDIQVACYIELDCNFDDITNVGTTLKEALKPQIDKWLQTSILNNTTIRPNNPRPCILKLKDCQLMLLNHTSEKGGFADNPVIIYMYTFVSPIITDVVPRTEKIKQLDIRIKTNSTAEEVGLDRYGVDNFTIADIDITYVTTIGIYPPTATSGTLDESDLTALTNVKQNLLRLNNELYHKNVENTSANK